MLLLVCLNGDLGSCWLSEALWEGQRSSFGFVCVPKLLRCKLSFSSGLEAFAQSQAQKRSEIWQLALVVFSPPAVFPKSTVCFREQDSGELV